MSNFIQLSAEDCTYLLELIADMDSDTAYTEKQRSYTVPKLHKIRKDPCSARLAYQDVDYLLDLIEDDELTETELQREHTSESLQAIQELQSARFARTRDIEKQRDSRRLKRLQASTRS